MGDGPSKPSRDDPREWGQAKELTAFESLMWRAEADAVLRSHMTAVEILDCVPDWDRLVAAHEWGTGIVRRLRQRVVEPLISLGPPVWAEGPDFDLAYHLRRVALPAPGGMRELLNLAQAMAMSPLDGSRPPWEAVLTRLGRSGTQANDLQASNVPGIGHTVYMAGAKVTHMYPFGPLPGCAAMVTLVSHAGTCCVGANLDRAAFTDTDLFAACLREGFDEVLALGRAGITPTEERTA